MKLYDLHSHWGTQRGYVLRTPAELAQQERIWRSPPTYATEEQMAAYFRAIGVRPVLNFGFTRHLSIPEVRDFHDYALETRRRFPDAIQGNWLQIDPRTGREGVRELERCLEADPGFIGYCVSGTASGLPASDPAWAPFYKLCIDARVPVLILVGYTGTGAGLPGGKGMLLDDCHPRHLDQVAARFPDLTIVAGRPAWPWQAEVIAVLLHKTSVWYELHGWSPKYFGGDLKAEIPRRLRDRVMFGADYPLFRYERLIADWEAEGYSSEVLEHVFFRNAEVFFAQVRH